VALFLLFGSGMRKILFGLPLAASLLACGGAQPTAPMDAPSKDQVARDAVEGKSDFSLDWCQAKGWYGDGECDTFCDQPDPDCG